ncbi:spermatogenesis-associated protein 7 isoform X4 [Rhineura floridana]|uniref:spermatogenesis-associated protein 7 isoform X4 n=1 Tax=Rhineura floridana TaxID=261503 RepID=UPI002AC7E71A|nr:spermatogenesis-associated protein 7 isoform X4 [Rhineura floridana]
MGVRMEGGGGDGRRRRSPVMEYQAIPRYGPASPFKGLLSTKSNAFCIDDSSRRLSNQYLIWDHMAVHYNKILSAKAAVDCSVPKSRLNSIKLSDQQRREKLKKEVERCEKEMISPTNVSRSISRESRRPLSATYRKVEDNADNKADEMKSVSQFSSPRVTSPCSAQSPTMRRIQAEEEELLYLNFIQDITDEILKLGLFSNRALERLFERHIEQNKNHLDETKMRHLLEILKVDLGCSKEEKSVGRSDMFDLLGSEPTEHFQLPSNAQRQNKLAKSEEFLKALDLITNEPAVPCVRRDKFEKVEGNNEFSSSMVTDETADTSCTLPPTLNSTTCDADFETSESLREVDELKDSLEEALPISTDNAQEQTTSSKTPSQAAHPASSAEI